MIHTFIFSERDQCANKTIERKALKRCTFSPDDHNKIYQERKGIRIKLSFNEENPIM